MSLATTPSNPIPTSHRLPSETLSLIFDLIERSQYPIVSQITRAFYDDLYPSLHQSVHIAVHKDKPIPSSFVAKSGEVPAGIEPGVAFGMKGAIYLALHHLHRLTTFSPTRRLPLPDRFTYITRLSISTHFYDQVNCKGYRPLILPKLHTLQIIPHSALKLAQSLDICSRPQTSVLDPKSHPTCSLLSALHPHQVILGGPYTTLTGDGAGLWTQGGQRIFPPTWLKEIVLFIGRYPLVSGRSFLSHLPSSIEKLVLGFAPVQGEAEWVPSAAISGDVMSSYAGNADPVQVWKRLAEICRGKAGKVEIVGLENVSAAVMGIPVGEDEREYAKDMISMACVSAGMGLVEAQGVAARIGFLDRGEWEKRQTEGY